jgi:hypothetical protein
MTIYETASTINDWLTGADEGLGVPEVHLKLRNPGWIKRPYETVYGLLSLAELAQLQHEHKNRLIAANIRAYKGKTEVNEQISATVRDEPEHFFYLNNGLTAFCERLEVNHLDRDNAAEKRLRAFGFSIVNGAQTLGSVGKAISTGTVPVPEGYVFLKVVSLERCLDDREFAERITRSTNFQNLIGSRDFVALDEQQERIARQLSLFGISYHFKEEADAPTPDETNFTLDEATTACACIPQRQDCDYCVRVLANRRSLWSFEPIYPEHEINRSIYSCVFRADRSARTVWRAVQAQRVVIETMKDNARASTGLRKTFYENARWLVLNVVYLKLRPEQGEALTLSDEEEANIATYTIRVADALWNACEAQRLVTLRPGTIDSYEQTRHFRSIFCDKSDCQRLRSSLLAMLAEPSVA